MFNYELKYFFYRAKAEPIRWVLKYLQIPFKDTIIDRWNEWPKIKNDMPFKQVPVLVVDNKLVIAQTTVILRYIAKKHGLEAKTVEEQALCDMYAEHAQDVFEKLRPWVITFTRGIMKEYFEQVRFKKFFTQKIFQREKQTQEVFIPVVKQDYGSNFEKRLKENETGFLVGDHVTWVDIFIAEFTDKLLTFGPNEVFENFPLLKEHHQKIVNYPTLQEHLKTRPDYVF